MIDTKLILLEGVMGAGKTTTAKHLAARLEPRGQPCRWYHEWSPDNPIRVDIRAGFEGTEPWGESDKTLAQWHALAWWKQDDDAVWILESKFWQNDSLFQFLAGKSIADIVAGNRRIIETVTDLNPVLLHFVCDDLDGHLARLFAERGGIVIPWPDRQPQRWDEWMAGAVGASPWCKARGFTKFEGYVAMYREWLCVCEALFEIFTGPKLTVRNPHQDWDAVYRQIEHFLGFADEDASQIQASTLDSDEEVVSSLHLTLA